MKNTRVIPCLLMRGSGLVKTVKFRNAQYVGDAINTVKIFNEKEVDELIFLDILATKNNKEPNYKLINEIARECFMPFSYGGGVRNFEQIKRILSSGAEKISLNSAFFKDVNIISKAANHFGSQSIIVSIDVKKNIMGNYSVCSDGGRKKQKESPTDVARKAEAAGAGEILLNSISNDGVMAGYDTKLIKEISEAVSIPVIACGGAGCLDDYRCAVKAGASAVAAGSLMVYQGKNKSVLTSYPTRQEISNVME
jgi:imidazole glycerol-phosphate synthase subunit HisF